MQKSKKAYCVLLKAMKITLQQLMLAVAFLSMSYAVNLNAQELLSKRVSLSVNEMQVEQVLDLISRQTKARFIYSAESIKAQRRISVDVREQELEKVLTTILAPLGVGFNVTDRGSILLKKLKTDALQKSDAETVIEDPVDRNITGRVTDEKGEGLPGVSIVVKGTQRGTISSTDGSFQLVIPDGDHTLIFSFVGYITQEISLGNRNYLEASMSVDQKSLEEVVVIGYGSVKKSDLTGAVADISGKNLKDLPVTSIDQKLVGQVAGVQIQQVSGAPGAGTSVKIRGSGSLGAGNEPLYVIDGMPYSSGLNQDINPLSFINPNDIETITVLKDASSTAIYGSRGANGVIMITTKNPQKNASQINFSASWGVQTVPQKGRPQMLNAREFADYQRDRIDYVVRQREGREPTLEDYPEEYRDLDKLNNVGTNWYDLILQNASVQDYNVDLQKGFQGGRIYFGLGYYDQDGTVQHTHFKRYSSNVGVQMDVLKTISLNANIRPVFIDQRRAVTGVGRDNSATGIALWANPVMSAYDEQGNLIPYINTPANPYNSTWGFPNPLFLLQESKRNYTEFRNLGNLSLDWKPLEGLTLRSALSTIFSVSKYNQYMPSTIGGANNPPSTGRGSANRVNGNSFNWLLENTATYTKQLDQHSFTILAGYTAQKATSNSVSLNAGPYPNDLIETINAAPGITSWGESVEAWSMISYLGRLNYSYRDRLFLTATLRSDGSSRFGVNNRYAVFPSAAVAYKIIDEKNNPSTLPIDNLKVRLSYGRSGNNNIGNYSHLSNVSMGQYVLNNEIVSTAAVSLFNPNLGWEESAQYDLGIETSFFNGKIDLTADIYHRKSVNMLLNDVIPAITGFNSQLVNKGSVRNRGVEIGLNIRPIERELVWETGFNIAFNRNKVLSTNQNGDRILSGNMDGRATNVTIVGKPIGQFYGFILDGVYSQADIDNPAVPKYNGATAGYPKYRDLNGDGIVSEILDYTDLGSPHPDFIYGMTNRWRYKNFDLALNLNGQVGGYIMNGMRQTIDNLQGFFNIGKEWVNRWRSDENPGDGIHALGPNAVHRVSDKLWLEKASYLRITNITLGYQLPVKPQFVKSIRAYVTVQNLLTLTDYTGANPEGQAANQNNTLVPGYDNATYPLARTASFGLNFQF